MSDLCLKVSRYLEEFFTLIILLGYEICLFDKIITSAFVMVGES